jgi:hypothetical protein
MFIPPVVPFGTRPALTRMPYQRRCATFAVGSTGRAAPDDLAYPARASRPGDLGGLVERHLHAARVLPVEEPVVGLQLRVELELAELQPEGVVDDRDLVDPAALGSAGEEAALEVEVAAAAR